MTTIYQDNAALAATTREQRRREELNLLMHEIDDGCQIVRTWVAALRDDGLDAAERAADIWRGLFAHAAEKLAAGEFE